MRRQPRVLVVDDSPTTCLFLASTLQLAGYEVEVALNGHEGLTRVTRFRPECLLLDIMLPDISGYAVCRQVQPHRSGQNIYIILISAKNTPLDQRYGLHQGAQRYLSKPVTAETLLRTVWEGLPPALRQSVSPEIEQFPTRDTSSPLAKLVPRRVVEQGMMRTNNPFAFASFIDDKYAHQLYTAIDGKKTVAELTAQLGLDDPTVTRLLRVLLEAHSIQVLNSAGQLAELVL